MKNKLPWQSNQFTDQNDDPLAGFANIMDVMLVFALGLMLALISQSNELRRHFALAPIEKDHESIEIKAGSELINAPDAIENAVNSPASGMHPLGQVYKDPKTGKLILISTEAK